MLELVIDYRENKLIKLLNEQDNISNTVNTKNVNNKNVNTKNANIKNTNTKNNKITNTKVCKKSNDLNMVASNLDLGDIIFNYYSIKAKGDDENINEELTDNNKLYEVIIERKEINDLISSIKDNRYKEQKIRILSQISKKQHHCELIYLIEGTVDKIRNPRDIKMYHGSIISMLLRDNIKLLFSDNIEETACIVKRIYSRIIKNPGEFKKRVVNDVNSLDTGDIDVSNSETKSIHINLHRGGSYLESRVKKKKSDNITSKNCGALMLTYIPNISLHFSTEILKHYDNKINKLIEFINDKTIENTEKIKNIATKRIKTISGKERNVGPATAKNLIEYLGS